MQKVLRIAALFIIAVAALGVNYGPKESHREPIKIGMISCLTGDCAEWGTAALKGAKLAVKEINAKGGVLGQVFALHVEDSAEQSPVNAVKAYQAVRNKTGSHYLIGPSWSAAGMAVAPMAAKEPDVMMVSPSLGIKEFNETAPNLFNLWPHDEAATRVLAQQAIKRGWKRTAIFGVQQVWTETQVRVFKEEYGSLGGEIVAEVSPLESARDLRLEALKIVGSKPDAILLACFSDQQGIAAREIRNLGYTGPKMSILVYSNAIPLANGGLEGTLAVSYAQPTAAFRESFHKEYGEKPNTSADVAYDAVYFYKEVIEQGGSPDAYSNVLAAGQNMKEFSGVSGTLHFDGKRGVTKAPVLYTVRGLEIVPIPQS